MGTIKPKAHARPVSKADYTQRQRETLEAYNKELQKVDQKIKDLKAKKRQIELDQKAEIDEKEKKTLDLKRSIIDDKIKLAQKELEFKHLEQRKGA